MRIHFTPLLEVSQTLYRAQEDIGSYGAKSVSAMVGGMMQNSRTRITIIFKVKRMTCKNWSQNSSSKIRITIKEYYPS